MRYQNDINNTYRDTSVYLKRKPLFIVLTKKQTNCLTPETVTYHLLKTIEKKINKRKAGRWSAKYLLIIDTCMNYNRV